MHARVRPTRVLSFALLALVAALCGASAARSPVRGAEGFKLADLDWLSGHWKQDAKSQLVEELWMPARGGMMLGLNRTSQEKHKAQFEYLRIEQQGDDVVYLASPGGSKPTPFKLAVLEKGHAVFENPEHDFPKVIEYRLEDDKLEVSIAADEPGPSWSFVRAGDVE